MKPIRPRMNRLRYGRMNNKVREAKRKMQEKGGNPTHLIIPTENIFNSTIKKQVQKHFNDIENSKAEFVGSLWGMDVYIDRKMEQGRACLIDNCSPKHYSVMMTFSKYTHSNSYDD